MSEFLEMWDEGIQRALESGEEQMLTTIVPCDCGALKLQSSARTMHPSFMAARPVKYDPERDQYQNATDRDRITGHQVNAVISGHDHSRRDK